MFQIRRVIGKKFIIRKCTSAYLPEKRPSYINIYIYVSDSHTTNAQLHQNLKTRYNHTHTHAHAHAQYTHTHNLCTHPQLSNSFFNLTTHTHAHTTTIFLMKINDSTLNIYINTAIDYICIFNVESLTLNTYVVV